MLHALLKIQRTRKIKTKTRKTQCREFHQLSKDHFLCLVHISTFCSLLCYKPPPNTHTLHPIKTNLIFLLKAIMHENRVLCMIFLKFPSIHTLKSNNLLCHLALIPTEPLIYTKSGSSNHCQVPCVPFLKII